MTGVLRKYSRENSMPFQNKMYLTLIIIGDKWYFSWALFQIRHFRLLSTLTCVSLGRGVTNGLNRAYCSVSARLKCQF